MKQIEYDWSIVVPCERNEIKYEKNYIWNN